jgi:hypothetical protein
VDRISISVRPSVFPPLPLQKTGEVLTLDNFRPEDTEQISSYFATHGFPAAITRAPIAVSGLYVSQLP